MRTALLLCVLLGIGCRKGSGPGGGDLPVPQHEASSPANEVDTVPSPPPPFDPVTVTVEQRSTSLLPLSNGKVRLTIDDITGGQVMASLSLEDGTPLHAPVSLRPGDTLSFKVGGRGFQVELSRLHNRLVGEDSAEFLLTSPADVSSDSLQANVPPPLSEREKIDRLIEAVAAQPKAVFVRNGREHSSKEAAEHLRRKWEAAGDRVTTAEAFIEHVASGSSLTGTPYSIRLPDGSEMTAAAFLRDELRKLQTPSAE